ncbi:MAG TPA: ABC transporter permease [Nitrospira sp.]|mgnify:FL=1|nr:FtsX-like permease family protein [Nitrospira sp.]MBS0175071.1 FtsX-like permease family protein [Nitrospira sp.]MBS0180490.1 FtsX-like permease family protein [Nitrospira sp.]MBX3337031.1 FtsX-like permease family protein [Nitrospira sp.]MCW5780039.1 FtsX-like permease family protein [Nitrospira sp.]
MSYVALKMLFGDRAKYLMLLCGLTFSVMLIVQQGSIFWGLMMWSQSSVTNINVPIWVTDPGIGQVDEVKPIADTAVDRVRSVSGVEWAVRLYKGVLRARLSNGDYHQITLTGLDAPTLIGRPTDVLEGRFEDILQPDAVVLDQWAVERMGGPTVITIGTVFELNDKLARVVAIAKTQKNFTNIPVVYTTYERAMRYVPRERRTLSYVLAKAKEGVPEAELTSRIQEQTGLGAYTAQDFGWKTISWVLKNTGIGINFGTTIVLGFIVGMAIAGQTFYLFTVENLKQFGALKAMGASTFTLARMILLQAFTVGFIGYGIGIGLATGFGLLSANSGGLPFVETWQLLLIVLIALLGICACSALISIVKLARLEPAIVFR